MGSMRGVGGVVVESSAAHVRTHQILAHDINLDEKFDNPITNYVCNGDMIDNSCCNDNSNSADKKKKTGRRSRRSKHNSSSLSPNIYVNGIQMEELDASGDGSPSNYEGMNESRAFISLPIIQLNEGMSLQEDGNFLQNGHIDNAEVFRKSHCNSSPNRIVSGESVGSSYVNKDLSPCHMIGGHARRKYFGPHLAEDEISYKIENGNLFRALFRVNAHNRMEAYCKIEGVEADILINGLVSQNRAIEGDIVAIEVDPSFLWTKMKGFTAAVSGCSSVVQCPLPSETAKLVQDGVKGKNKFDSEDACCENGVYLENGYGSPENNHAEPVGSVDIFPANHNFRTASNLSGDTSVVNVVGTLSAVVNANPSKRPTGRVVGIIDKSPHRDTVVGFLNFKQWSFSRDNSRRDLKKNRQLAPIREYILLTPTDARYPKMMVTISNLPDNIKQRLEGGDLETCLVAARIVEWAEESYLPEAQVMREFGKGGVIEAHIAAILFENAIDVSEFPPKVLSCLPSLPWQIPPEEFERRRDFRDLCVFTIDPATATDLDDAISVENLSNGTYRVGVHIADASYFVLPGTDLDIDAQIRSTSVYCMQRKFPMLPPLLSENLGSLNPGADRLAFSIIWDIDPLGKILDQWIGRSVIHSCCKLSYEHAQAIIDGVFDTQSASAEETSWPNLHGNYEWSDVLKAVKSLHQITRVLKQSRFNDGALSLENPKIIFLFDEDGIPYDGMLCGRKDSNFLVEELMLLANRTAAEVITRAYPSCALLRRHPEPNLRKLKGFQSFCSKHGLELDASSSGQLHQSLERLRGELKNDTVLFDILMSYAVRPMQLAAYFSTGDLKDMESSWGHYALAVPLYTHFTSPLRRYPDIVVHRTLAATVEAEEILLKRQRSSQLIGAAVKSTRCFTGIHCDRDAIGSLEAQAALSETASKYRVPCTEFLTGIAEHCNERKLACRHVKDAIERLCMWALLKREEILYSEALVLSLGPKFMSVYIHKLAIERRIYYDDVDGLMVDWLDTTSTLVLSQPINKRNTRKGSPGKGKTLEEVALVIGPFYSGSQVDVSDQYSKQNCESKLGEFDQCAQGDVSSSFLSGTRNIEPAVFPLTLRLLSKIPVALHAIGGDDGPLDIAARLFISSYFK